MSRRIVDVVIRDCGTAVVEFALGSTVFFAIIFAMIEFGWLGYNQAALHFATHEATRYAVVHGGTATADELRSIITSNLFGISATPTINETKVTDPVTGIAFLTLTASLSYDPVVPLVPLETIQLSAQASGNF